MRSWLWALLLLVLAGPLAAQATPRTCDTAEKANFRRIRNSRGEETIFIQGPTRFVCTGGVEVRADSAVWRRTTGELELIRHVFYRDSTRTLSADWANFLGNTSTLFARGSVLLTDLESGSVVRGQQLEYEQQTQQRPMARAIVQGGRPHATLHPPADTTAPIAGPGMRGRGGASNDTTPPIQVDANWMEFLGTGLFRAKNDVVIVRGKTDAYADSAEFDQTGGRLSLRRQARVVDPQYRLAADSIDAYLTDNALRDVEAVGEVQLHSEDLQVTAPRLSIGFLGGQFEDMRAWVPGRLAALAAAAPPDTGRAPKPDTTAGPRAEPDTVHLAAARPDTTRTAPDTGRVAMADTARVVGPDTAHVVKPASADTAAATVGARSDTAATAVPPPPALPPGAPAAHWGTATTYADSVQAVAVAKEFRLEADSIRAVAPGQELDRVIAIGQAYGVRLGDSLGISLPPEAAHDWVRGDTIIGYFAADTTAAAPSATDSARLGRFALTRRGALPGDTTPPVGPDSVARGDSAVSTRDSTVQRTLEKVIVIGGTELARSLYRIQPQDTNTAQPAPTSEAGQPAAADTAVRDTALAAADTVAEDTTAADTAAAGPKPGINYMTARRITLHLKHGQVQRVEAEGPIQGLYLDPIKHTERPDTTGTPQIAKPNG
ncbi:MAG: hypothetical protein P8099_12780 [Gemmatimonadota bacterium]|jgi:hypothetical protein